MIFLLFSKSLGDLLWNAKQFRVLLFKNIDRQIYIFLPFKERPRSAVEQLCLAESTRPRMTVEEQMERIKRHQQACLREKRKGLNIIGVSDQSPSQSLSFVRDNPFKSVQVGPTFFKNLTCPVKKKNAKLFLLQNCSFSKITRYCRCVFETACIE